MTATQSTFSARKIELLRRRARRAARSARETVTESLPPEMRDLLDEVDATRSMRETWSKSLYDPMALLGVFRALRIRDGYVLRGYQFRAGDNGNGVVWAMPADAPFPDPRQCRRRTGGWLRAPRPAQALDDFMSVVEGDGTPWSYLSASLLARELEELGALWHGCSWSTHEIIDSDPRTKPRSSDWEMQGEAPDDWRPSVVESARRVTVSFQSASGVGRWTIYRHVDTYRPGSYSFRSKQTTLATGPGGYIF